MTDASRRVSQFRRGLAWSHRAEAGEPTPPLPLPAQIDKIVVAGQGRTDGGTTTGTNALRGGGVRGRNVALLVHQPALDRHERMTLSGQIRGDHEDGTSLDAPGVSLEPPPFPGVAAPWEGGSGGGDL